MTLNWEKRYPGVIAAGFAAAYYYADRHFQLPPPPRDLMAVVVSVSAIAVGFLATAKAILFTIQDRTVIKYFKDSARHTTLVVGHSFWNDCMGVSCGCCNPLLFSGSPNLRFDSALPGMRGHWAVPPARQWFPVA